MQVQDSPSQSRCEMFPLWELDDWGFHSQGGIQNGWFIWKIPIYKDG